MIINILSGQFTVDRVSSSAVQCVSCKKIMSNCSHFRKLKAVSHLVVQRRPRVFILMSSIAKNKQEKTGLVQIILTVES